MLPIHVINLARNPERLAHMAAELGRLGLAWQRFEAVDRLRESEARLTAAFGTGRLARDYPATPGDMACSLSHQRLWQAIAAGPAEAAVVLEDDARLAEGFADFADEAVVARMLQHTMGVLKLEFWPGPQQSRRLPLGQALGEAAAGSVLYRMRSTFLGSCAYVLTRPAAAALLAGFPRLRVPVDHVLFGQSARMGFDLLRPGFANPAPVMHDVTAFRSDIGPEREAAGLDRAPRTVSRRLRDHRARRHQASEVRNGTADVVTMCFAGAGRFAGAD